MNKDEAESIVHWLKINEKLMQELSTLTAKVKRYEKALLSISKNSCCGQCQEAKLVSLSALNQTSED